MVILSRFSPSQSSRGFSFVELLVALAIFTLLSTFFIINFNTVNSRIALDNEAHEIALWIREAQAYAMGIKTQGTANVRTYGMYFAQLQPDTFVLYVDRDGDRRYNSSETAVCGSAAAECIKRVELPARMILTDLKIGANTGALSTPASGVLDISFTRPNVDARITDGSPPPTSEYGVGRFTLRSVKGFSRAITVLASGQISVQ